jgi:ATP-dependent Clp protease ATP-binding subunit ClpC
LQKEDIFKIIDIAIKDVFKRIEDLGYKLEITEKAKDYIAEKGFDPQFGARPLKRAIQKYVEDTVAEKIISGAVKEGEKLLIDLNAENEIAVSTVKKAKKLKDAPSEEEGA